MKALKKTCTTVLLLLTIIAAHAHQSNIIGMHWGQPFDISIVSATQATQNITLSCITTPNNTYELVLKTEGSISEDLEYLLYNAEGLVMKSSRIENNSATIDLTDMASKTYFLIVSNAYVSKTFKIGKKTESNGVITMSK